MIITALLNLIANLLSAVLVFDLPKWPSQIDQVFQTVISWMVTGVEVLRAFLGQETLTVISVLLGLVLAMNAAYLVYSLVFWVLRKIPMLGIKE